MRSHPARRRFALLALFGAAAAAGCSAESRRAWGTLCGGCVWLSGTVAKRAYEDHRATERLLAQCGPCAEGDDCNLLYDPPRCAAKPGTAGVRCGGWSLNGQPSAHEPTWERTYWCKPPLSCDLKTKTCQPPAP